MTKKPNHLLFSSGWVTLTLAAIGVAFTDPTLGEETPQIRLRGRVEVRALDETSGLVASRQNSGILWLHNDGASPRVYAVNEAGQHVATLDVAAVVTDVEDIALGPGPVKDIDYLYLGDIGDNETRRRTLKICRVPEPTLDTQHRAHLRTTEAEEFYLELPGDAQDCEALLVDPATGDLYIVAKLKKRGYVYMVPASALRPGETSKLKLVLNLKVKSVSAGDISPDGQNIILRNETDGWLWRRRPGESIVEALALRSPHEVPVRTRSQARNGESVGFSSDSQGYYTISEGNRQPLYWFKVPEQEEG